MGHPLHSRNFAGQGLKNLSYRVDVHERTVLMQRARLIYRLEASLSATYMSKDPASTEVNRLFHRDLDAACRSHIQLQALIPRIQAHDHPILVFEPQPAATATQGDAHIQLGIGTRKFRYVI